MNDRTEAIDRLLNNLVPIDPAHEARYRSILDAGLADLKPGGGKARYIAIGLAGLIACLVCGSLGLTEPESTPRTVRWLLILFAFFGLGWTLLAAWLLARRYGNFAAERIVAARMAFGFTLVAVMALSLTSSLLGKESASLPLVATGLALLILGAVLLISARIEQAEQSIREQILRLECRTAGFAEAVGHGRGERTE